MMPNPSTEGMTKRLRLSVIPHVKHQALRGNLMRYSTLLIALATPAAALAASAAQAVNISIDQDVLVLLKGAIWAGGVFLAAFAFIGIAFFGWDVRQARASLMGAQKETRDLLDDLKTDLTEMNALKEKLQQLGAQLEEGSTQEIKEQPLERATERSSLDLIREVIQTSSYEWTTIGRVVKRTGLNRESVLEEVRKASDIRISSGRKTQDFIFKENN